MSNANPSLSPPPTGSSPITQPARHLFSSLERWLASAPEGALDVILARVSASDGAEVLVKGRVADLSDQRAQLELVDSSFTPCDEREGDSCKTPWDYCCEDATTLAGGTLVVEFREAGELMRTPVRGFHGCDHLVSATVRGTAELDEAGNLILVASGIHVSP